MQEYKVRARTFEIDEDGNPITYGAMEEDLTILSGKAAGACYMPDDYMENGIQNVDSALNRANNNVKSGHHSVFDHGHITLELKTNKMIAMILNSVGVYATSEKSGRYTKMHPETERELELYDKWTDIIQNLVLDEYPEMDDAWLQRLMVKKTGKDVVVKNRMADVDENDMEIFNKLLRSKNCPSYKIAQENARYMSSVFVPTVMLYTISYRQACLIHNYADILYQNLLYTDNAFGRKLMPHIIELRDEMAKILGMNEENKAVYVKDNKNQCFRFLASQHMGEIINNKFIPYDEKEKILMRRIKRTSIADSYTLNYRGTFTMLAQNMRHRTIRYFMYLEESGEYGYYTPPIVKKKGREDEWQNDIQSIGYCFPQGTIVEITEQGIVEDFVLKCKERLCGRAQLEIMNVHQDIAKQFYSNIDKLSYTNRKLILSMFSKEGELLPRCMFNDFTCTEGCSWGPKNAFNRLI